MGQPQLVIGQRKPVVEPLGLFEGGLRLGQPALPKRQQAVGAMGEKLLRRLLLENVDVLSGFIQLVEVEAGQRPAGAVSLVLVAERHGFRIALLGFREVAGALPEGRLEAPQGRFGGVGGNGLGGQPPGLVDPVGQSGEPRETQLRRGGGRIGLQRQPAVGLGPLGLAHGQPGGPLSGRPTPGSGTMRATISECFPCSRRASAKSRARSGAAQLLCRANAIA